MRRIYNSQGFTQLTLLLFTVFVIAAIALSGYAVEQRVQHAAAPATTLTTVASTSADLGGTSGANVSVTGASPATSSNTTSTSASSGSGSASSSQGTGTVPTTPPIVTIEPTTTDKPIVKLYHVNGMFTEQSTKGTAPIANHTVKIYHTIAPSCGPHMECPQYIAVLLYATLTTDANGHFSADVPVGNYQVRLDPDVCSQPQLWYFTETGQYELDLSFTANCSLRAL